MGERSGEWHGRREVRTWFRWGGGRNPNLQETRLHWCAESY